MLAGGRVVVAAATCAGHMHEGRWQDGCCCAAGLVGLEPPTGTIAWTRPLRRGVATWPLTLGTDGRLYTLSRRYRDRGNIIWLTAIAPADGRPVWEREVSVQGTLGYHEGVLVGTTTDEAGCVATGASDGKELWRQPKVRCEELSRALRGGRVYTLSGGLVALDAKTGATLWRRDLPGGARHYDKLVAVKGALVAAGPNGHLAAFDLPDGSLRWQHQVTLRWPYQLLGLLPFGFGFVAQYRHTGLTVVQ